MCVCVCVCVRARVLKQSENCSKLDSKQHQMRKIDNHLDYLVLIKAFLMEVSG